MITSFAPSFRTSLLLLLLLAPLQLQLLQHPLRQHLVLPRVTRYSSELQPVHPQEQRYFDYEDLKSYDELRRKGNSSHPRAR